MVAQLVETVGRDERLVGATADHHEAWIGADELEIDHSYQRSRIRPSWVKQIAENFDPDLLQPLRVNLRRWDGDRYVVMDGQHRLLAVRRLGWHEQKLPCIVYDNLPYEVEAKLFDTQGYSRPLTPAERFKSELSRHEPEAAIIDGMVRRAGFQINFADSTLDGGRITSVQTLRRVLRKYRSGTLAETLAVIAEGLGTEHGPKGQLIDGMGVFLGRYAAHANYDRRRLITKLRETTGTALLGKGAEIANAMHCSPGEGVGAAIHHAYNYKLRDDRGLPDWSFGRPKKG